MSIFLSIIIAICFLCILSALMSFAKTHPRLFVFVAVGLIVFFLLYSKFRGE